LGYDESGKVVVASTRVHYQHQDLIETIAVNMVESTYSAFEVVRAVVQEWNGQEWSTIREF